MMNRSYRRTRYLVKKKFQLKYVGLILAVMFGGALITGFTIYYNSWVLLGDKLANVYPQGMLLHIFRSVNIKLAVNLILVAIFCTALGIMASHRIAGPIDRMVNFVEYVAKGDYKKRLTLRKGDELKELATAINRLVDKLEKEKKS